MTILRKIKSKTVPSLNVYKARKNVGSVLVSIFRYVLLGAVSYIVLYPLFAMLALSFLSETDVLDSSVTWIAKNPSFDNFAFAWDAMEYPSALLSTILVGGVSAFLEIFSCAIAAYGFSRFKFKEKNLLFGLVLLTAIVPVQILVLPLFINYKYFDFAGILSIFSSDASIDLINTPFTFWLPSLFGVGLRSGLFIFIYRQFFLGLPKELEEASWIDGCGPLKTFFRIVIPSSGVVFLTVSIFAIIWHWNEYYQSVIFFTESFPLSVQLSNIEIAIHSIGTQEGAYRIPYICSACLMFITPMLVMFLVLQKKFIQSIDRVGIVG